LKFILLKQYKEKNSVQQGCIFIKGSPFLTSENFKCKSSFRRNRNTMLPTFQKRKFLLKEKTIWRMYWLIKREVKTMQLKNLL